MPDGLSAAKFDILREIYDVVREQGTLIEADDVDNLRALMDRRDELLAQLEELIDDDAQPPTNIVALPSAVAESEQDVIALDTVIRGIMEHDRRNEEMLTARMETLASQLPQLQRGRAANAQYRLTDPRSGYVDHVS